MTASQSSEYADLAHFLSLPWCAAQLTALRVRTWVPPASRVRKPSGEDELFSTTLNTPQTIPAFVLFYDEPPDAKAQVDELKALFALGPGVQGYSNVVHGGIVATLLDEVLGALPVLNARRGAFPKEAFMTRYLNTSFLRPVKTPNTILVTAKIVDFKDRKVFVEGHIQDGDGFVLAKADALFVSVGRSPRL
jgi:acyl-coenzyme A thioesterase PaaI-like protein